MSATMNVLLDAPPILPMVCELSGGQEAGRTVGRSAFARCIDREYPSISLLTGVDGVCNPVI